MTAESRESTGFTVRRRTCGYSGPERPLKQTTTRAPSERVSSDSPGNLPSLLAQRPFVLFWTARVCATVAYQMLGVAVGWQIYEMTGSAFQLGLVGLVEFVPVVVLSLLAGHLADRYDRRQIIRICQSVEAVAAAVLALGSAGGWLSTAGILAIVFVIGSARAFELPTLHALVPGLVATTLFSRAVAASASASQAATIAGPAVGGLLYSLGPAVVYGVCSALYLGASVAMTLIRVEPPPRSREPVTLRSLFAGVSYIRSRPALSGILSLDLFAVLLGGATALLPVFARDILGCGPWGLGILRSAPALGALSISILLARFPLKRHVGKALFASIAVFGLATTVFALSSSLALSLAALTLLGAADAVSVVIRFSLVQLETPENMRGRVSTVNAVFTGTSNTLGDFESGVTAAWFGAIPAVLIGGIGTLLVAFIWMRSFPQLVRIESLDPPG
jgi:MFS family permease